MDCDASPDLSGRVASLRARIVVFVVVCQSVQMFMSYDGGAISSSLRSLQILMHDQPWTAFELGILGAMDKLGMVFFAVPWGLALKCCSAKFLMSVCILLNAGSSCVFGLVPSRVPGQWTKTSMYAARFLMGATQSLQGVWGTAWTITMAPPNRKTMWFGLGAVSAGIGNGLGFAVAGFGTDAGLPFYFAFEVAGAILAMHWLAVLVFPAKWLSTSSGRAMQFREANVPLSSQSGQGRGWSSQATRKELSEMLSNRVYLWTAFAISLTQFETSAIQYLWNRVFAALWPDVPMTTITAMFLVVIGSSSGLGIMVGPRFIDRQGGFATPPGVVKCLQILLYFQFVALLAGAAGILCLYRRMHHQDGAVIWWLWLTWACIFLILFAQNACVAALCGINVEVIPERSRTFASGAEIAVRNIFGYMSGPLLPSVVMSANSLSSEEDQLSYGLGFVFLVNVVGVVLVGAALASGRLFVTEQQSKALDAIRDAMNAQDIEALRQAVDRAKQVDLCKHRYGIWIVAMADRMIEQLNVGQIPSFSLRSPQHSTRDQGLTERAEILERAIAHGLLDVRRLEVELRQLRGGVVSDDAGGAEASPSLRW